jgi:hypothetical protein
LVLEQKEPIMSCLGFNKLIVLDSSILPTALPVQVLKEMLHCWLLLQQQWSAKPKRAGLLLLWRRGGGFGSSDGAAARQKGSEF